VAKNCFNVGLGVLALALSKNLPSPEKRRKNNHPKSTAKSRIWVTETPELIATKFCMSGSVHDVTTHASFAEDWLRGFGVARGQICSKTENIYVKT